MSILQKRISHLLVSSLLIPTLLALTLTISASPVTQAQATNRQIAYADLHHTPYRNADLSWDYKTKKLTVVINLTGLAPNSTHPAHIHLGVCTSNGAIKYALNNVNADKAGNANSRTVISNVENGIPKSGWYINVHNGPHLSPADQYIPIACGNITNSQTSTKKSQHVIIGLGATDAPNQSVYGFSYLSLNNNVLYVTVSLYGLVPGSSHAVHIHAGSCQSQLPGTVLYHLPNAVGDSFGAATIEASFKNVRSIPSKGWYVNVHRTTDLSTQTGFDPISCGNVTLA